MPERFALFVYGHLRRGHVGYELLGLAQRTIWIGEAQVRGRLYDIGDYPALVTGGARIAHGELLVFDDPSLWVALDDYEDCIPDNPEASEYRRIEVDLIGDGRAWAYVYNRSIDRHEIISGGRAP